MINLISGAINQINSLLKVVQIKQFLSVVMVGFLVLTTNVAMGHDTKAGIKQVDKTAHQIDSTRPKTTGEWQKEARATKGAPGERLENIAEESAKAVKEWGSLYPDTAKRSARELKEGIAK